LLFGDVKADRRQRGSRLKLLSPSRTARNMLATWILFINNINRLRYDAQIANPLV
jgi:hypothetical protein